ncbi:MAG: hypothetical protein ACRDRZ_10065 [Pseudonocardiaceae bacterium]
MRLRDRVTYIQGAASLLWLALRELVRPAPSNFYEETARRERKRHHR